MSAIISLSHNENPYGPSPAAIEAVTKLSASGNRYAPELGQQLIGAVARHHDVPRGWVRLSGGSGDIMRAAVRAWTSRTRTLVTASPSYELPMRMAQHIGTPVVRVRLTPALRIDPEAMARRALAPGLIYVCNPNNPTGTCLHEHEVRALVAGIARRVPDACVLVDEAYLDYANAPLRDTAIRLIAEFPQVVVTRSFSKVHGMAGMRVGYAVGQPAALARLAPFHSGSTIGAMSLAAAMVSLGDTVRVASMAALNNEVRALTAGAFERAGYRVAPSEANFVFVNIGASATAFLDACGRAGVHVGRPFAPFGTWARVSIGTREEMDAATPLMLRVLAGPGVATQRT